MITINSKYQIRKIAEKFKALVSINECKIICYRSGSLYIYNINDNGYEKIVNLNKGIIWFLCSKVRILERIFRMEPRFALKVNQDDYIVSYRGAMYKLSLARKEIVKEHTFVRGMNNPLNACVIKDLNGFTDGLYYGEYIGNSQKREISIYRRDLNTCQWERVYKFKNGQINHIHNIIPNYETNELLILTGDTDDASGIWVSQNNFKVVAPILIGNQGYRSCNIFTYGNEYVYATDTPTESNHIVHCKKTDNSFSVDYLLKMPGSVIYSIENNGYFYFSTTVEPDSKKKGLRYLLSNKIGPGIIDKYVYIIAGNLNTGFQVIAKYRKDIYPMGLCQFGAANFTNMSKDRVLMQPVAVTENENALILIERLDMS